MKNSTRFPRKVHFLCVLLLLGFLQGSSQQTKNWIYDKYNNEIAFFEYVPTDYAADPNKKYPLIIFLHGHGERGNGRSELDRVLLNGTPPKIIADGHNMEFSWNGKKEKFIVISPQLNSAHGSWWPTWYTDELLAYAMKKYRIDPDRVFLTGLSMGGGGTWTYAIASPENAKKFAALGVCCGACSGGNWCNIANANLPVWAFHAKDDSSPAPWTCTDGAIREINNCNPAVKPYFTTWLNGNHSIWGRVYDVGYNWQQPNLYEWFLAQNRSLPVNKRPVAEASDVTINTAVGVVTLDASASSDPDGKIVMTIWRKISGPGTITTPLTEKGITTVTGLTTAGTYQYEVKVVDDRADWTLKTITVTVTAGPPGSLKPKADAGPDQLIYLPTSTVKLDGTKSADPDGSIASYEWTQLTGPVTGNFNDKKIASPTVSNLAAGNYTFRLVVTDNSGNTGEDVVAITVKNANIFPVPRAGADNTITLPLNNATLDGSQSYDPDGTLKNFNWAYISGPSQYEITNPDAQTTTVTKLVEGTYLFKLRVWDDFWEPADDTVKLVVKPEPPPPVNTAPVANAGADIEITGPANNTNLNGSGSSDPENNINSYLWSYVSGPSQYNISNPAAATTALTDLVTGTYQFKLVVTDKGGLSDEDLIIVTVHPAPVVNRPPVANAGPNISITLPTRNTNLNGSLSSDPDLNISSYAWTWISGPADYHIGNPAAASSTLTNLVEGVYHFRLVVTDSDGLSNSDTVQVTVNAATPVNQPPVAYAGTDITMTLPMKETSLSGASSYDPDGSITAYAWAWISGPTQFDIGSPAASATTLTNLAEGTYQFKLTVTDNGGLTNNDTIRIIVKPAPPANKPPVANAGTDLTITLPADYTTLDGNKSNDPDGTITNYSWTWISGPSKYTIATSTKVSTQVTGLTEGVYAFRLIITDNGGLTHSDTVRVTVNAAPNKLPTANAGADITLTLPTNNTTLNGSSSKDDDGSITKYAWTWVSGPAQYHLSNAAIESPGLSNLVVGTYQFKLEITDNRGGTSSDVVLVTVKPAPKTLPEAKAGNDIVVYLPSPVIQLNGNNSLDPDGSIVSYVWRKISGGNATLVNGNTAIATVLTTVAGEYAFELLVTDNHGATSKDTVLVTVQPAPNMKPVAKAGKDTGIAVPSTVAFLHGSGSYDADGVIILAAWRQVEGPQKATIANPGSVSTPVGDLVTGEYTFELTVTDNKGATGKDSVVVSVVNNFKYEESMAIYPNPTQGPLNIRCVSDTTGMVRATIYNIHGRQVRVFNFNKQQSVVIEPLNVGDIPKGLYYLELIIDNKKRMVTKFVKQ